MTARDESRSQPVPGLRAEVADLEQAAGRITCWACGNPIPPDKASRALCSECAYGGYFGGS